MLVVMMDRCGREEREINTTSNETLLASFLGDGCRRGAAGQARTRVEVATIDMPKAAGLSPALYLRVELGCD